MTAPKSSHREALPTKSRLPPNLTSRPSSLSRPSVDVVTNSTVYGALLPARQGVRQCST